MLRNAKEGQGMLRQAKEGRWASTCLARLEKEEYGYTSSKHDTQKHTQMLCFAENMEALQ